MQFAFAIGGLGGFNSAVTIPPASVSIVATSGGQCGVGGAGWSQQSDSGTVTLTLPLSNCTTIHNYNVNLTMCGGNICHGSTVNVQVFSTGTFSLTATPATKSVSPGDSATFSINVASANNFIGQVAFNTSALPACAAPTFPLVTAPGAGNLVLGTASCAPGTYAVNIVGVSGSTSVSVPVTLVVLGPAAPANITSPGASSILSGDSATFTWDSGSQVTQYQLDLAATDDGTVCSPRYSGGTGNSASMSLSPCCGTRRRPLTATLTSTFASGGPQSRSYNYTCGLPASSPAVVSVAPPQGSGSAQSFTAVYYDINGGSDISQARVLIQPDVTSSPANQCIMRYDPATNSIYLLADDGVTYLGPIMGGGYDTLANSQCAITGGYSVQVSASTLAVDFSAVFASSFAGAKQVFLSAVDNAGHASDVTAVGTWTVPTGTASGGETPTPATPTEPVLPTPTPTLPGPVTGSVQACSDISGTWSDPNIIDPGRNPGVWDLIQHGDGTVSGTLTNTYCEVAHPVTGTVTSLTASATSTGICPAQQYTSTTISASLNTIGCTAATVNSEIVTKTPPTSATADLTSASFAGQPPATSWTRRTFPTELGVTFDLAASKATVILKGPRTGDLKVELLPFGSTTPTLIGQQQSASPGTSGQIAYEFPFDRTVLPAPADFGRVQGHWGDPSDPNSLAVDFPVSFTTIGYTHFTRYNTTTESKCLPTAHPSTAYVFTGADCHVDTYQLNSQFISQASINGTGRTDSLPGYLLHTFGSGPSPTLYAACKDHIPVGGVVATLNIPGNTFVLIPEPPAGTCSSGLSNDISLATYPYPTKTGTVWRCDDQVMLVKPGNALDSMKVVQDACPLCRGGFGPQTIAHIDTYTSSPGCTKNDPTIGNYGDFYAIRIRQ